MVKKEYISEVKDCVQPNFNSTIGKPVDSFDLVQVFKTPTSREEETEPLSPITKLNTLVNNYDDGTQSYVRLSVKIKTTISTQGQQKFIDIFKYLVDNGNQNLYKTHNIIDTYGKDFPFEGKKKQWISYVK
ncbi:hypothetical protein DLAC_02652 [Tieghemostelium lacteum]|uniref:Uncharacterized protein n=1 Tax=Tieghemostelium lacteum TaxID=361077 RepID=A0A152A3F0_TIELA|nr:hypothetical protein DLAC_02652 [Tieghemostelium lacteum]|eukprot:KYR00627.1 hypothetical protein DLAC_02652 [Tieghemostelium lacteum]